MIYFLKKILISRKIKSEICRFITENTVNPEKNKNGGNFKSLQKWQKILVAICKWSVFGGYSSSFAEATEDKLGSHAKTTISNSSTIFFQPNFAGLLKLPRGIKKEKTQKEFELRKKQCIVFLKTKTLTFNWQVALWLKM